MAFSHPNRLIIHYYSGAGLLRRFGHVAIEYNGMYFSYGPGPKTQNTVIFTIDEIIKAETQFYGPHTPIVLQPPTSTFDLKNYWEKEWRPLDYEIMEHCCTHSALSCLQKLGLLEKLPRAEREKLEKILENREILRPSVLAYVFNELATIDIGKRRRALSEENRLYWKSEPNEEELNALKQSIWQSFEEEKPEEKSMGRTPFTFPELKQKFVSAFLAMDTMTLSQMCQRSNWTPAEWIRKIKNSATQTDMQMLIDKATPQLIDSLTYLSGKTQVRPTLQLLLAQSLPMVDLKRMMQNMLYSLQELKWSEALKRNFRQTLRLMQITEPNVKNRIANLLEEEIQLFRDMTDAKKFQKFFGFYVDLMILKNNLPKMNLIDLNKEVSELLLKNRPTLNKYPAIGKSLSNNLMNCQTAINALNRDQLAYSEREYNILLNRQLMTQSLQDAIDKIRHKAAKIGLAARLDMTRLFGRYLELREQNAAESLIILDRYYLVLSQLGGLFQRNKSKNYDEWKWNEKDKTKIAQVDAVIKKLQDPAVPLAVTFKASEDATEEEMASILKSKKDSIVEDKLDAGWQRGHSEWMQYRLLNIMYWYKEESKVSNAETMLKLIDQIQKIETESTKGDGNSLNMVIRHNIFTQQANVLEAAWEEKNQQYSKGKTEKTIKRMNDHPDKYRMTREIGLLLQEIHTLSEQKSLLQDLESSIQIAPGSQLQDDLAAEDLCFDLYESLVGADSKSDGISHLLGCMNSLQKFRIEGVITPRLELQEILLEIQHTLEIGRKTKRAKDDLYPIRLEQMLKQFDSKNVPKVELPSPQVATHLFEGLFETKEAPISYQTAWLSTMKALFSEQNAALWHELPNETRQQFLRLEALSHEVIAALRTEVLKILGNLQQSSPQSSGALTFFSNKVEKLRGDTTVERYTGLLHLLEMSEQNRPIPPTMAGESTKSYLERLGSQTGTSPQLGMD